MKNLKLIAVILLALLVSLAACSNQAQEETEMDITGITWQWLRFEDSTGSNNIEVSDPTSYNLILISDGSYNANVDCNQVIGSYTLEGNSITFVPGFTTLAECGPESHYYTFLDQLTKVATFVMDGDNLVLNLSADGGNLVFAPAE